MYIGENDCDNAIYDAARTEDGYDVVQLVTAESGDWNGLPEIIFGAVNAMEL